MKRFLKEILWFLLLPLVLVVVAVLLPPTKGLSDSLFFTKLEKDRLLRNSPPPRIILVGDSSLSYGMNSALFQETLGLYPVNTALTADTGLLFDLDHAAPWIQSEDIVIVAPSYDHYFGKRPFGRPELLFLILDLTPGEARNLGLEQWHHLVGFLPDFVRSKYTPSNYRVRKFHPMYGADVINEFGDAVAHWEMEPADYYHPIVLRDAFEPRVVEALQEFQERVQRQGGLMFCTFPGMEAANFEANREAIESVFAVLNQSGLRLLGTPDTFVVPRDWTYDSPLHLTREGADHRTRLVIEELRKHPAYVEWEAQRNPR